MIKINMEIAIITLGLFSNSSARSARLSRSLGASFTHKKRHHGVLFIIN